MGVPAESRLKLITNEAPDFTGKDEE